MNLGSQTKRWTAPARRTVRLPAGSAVLVAVLGLATLPACKGAEEAPAPEIRPVRVVTIEKRESADVASLTGVVQAQTETNQSFRIDGRLLERLVDVGDVVKTGQLLARLDPQNEESSLQSARAQLAAARAQLAEARNHYGRMKELVAEDAVSRASFEQAETLLKTAESQVQAVQGQVNLAENRMGFTRLTATVAGVVTARGAEPGEVVGPGRMIVQIAAEGARDAVFGVPARLKDAAPSSPAITVELASDPRVKAAARVREVAPRADPVTGTFAVRLRLIDPPAAMRLGSTVTARMRLAAGKGIEVPASALFRADGKPAVWVVDPKTSTVSSRAVELQAQDANTLQIGSGLVPGDVVVTAGVQALRPGQKVRLLEAAK